MMKREEVYKSLIELVYTLPIFSLILLFLINK
jgi:hypothetical protein